MAPKTGRRHLSEIEEGMIIASSTTLGALPLFLSALVDPAAQ
jgi:hypothetical protein